MEINETENFYQISTKENYSEKFIVSCLKKLGGDMVFLEFMNTYEERLAITYDSVDEAIDFIQRIGLLEIKVTVLKGDTN